MRVEYHDQALRRITEEFDYSPTEWDPAVTRAFRRRVQLIAAAPSEHDLYAMRSLRMEVLRGNRQGQSSMRVNDQLRLILTFKTETEPVAVLLEVVECH